METPKHTPGPWTHKPRARDGHVDTICKNGHVFIQVGVPWAEQPVLDYPHENTQTANARLIASIPDLLDELHNAACTLEDLLEWLKAYAEPGQALRVKTVAEDVRVAIAKATQP